MWAKDLLIVEGVCHPGELIRQYRCVMPSVPVPPTSNAVLVKLVGKDRFGKLQVITMVRCLRAEIRGNQVEFNISPATANILTEKEVRALIGILKRDYSKAYRNSESQAALALIRNP